MAPFGCASFRKGEAVTGEIEDTTEAKQAGGAEEIAKRGIKQMQDKKVAGGFPVSQTVYPAAALFRRPLEYIFEEP